MSTPQTTTTKSTDNLIILLDLLGLKGAKRYWYLRGILIRSTTYDMKDLKLWTTIKMPISYELTGSYEQVSAQNPHRETQDA